MSRSFKRVKASSYLIQRWLFGDKFGDESVKEAVKYIYKNMRGRPLWTDNPYSYLKDKTDSTERALTRHCRHMSKKIDIYSVSEQDSLQMSTEKAARIKAKTNYWYDFY